MKDFEKPTIYKNVPTHTTDHTVVNSPKERLVMFDIADSDKKLILHAAYYAVKAHDWRHNVFSADIDKEIKKDLIGRFPCGDPLNNLLNLASRLLRDFDENAPINGEIEKIKKYVYGT